MTWNFYENLSYYFKIGQLSTIHVNKSQKLFDNYFKYDLEEQVYGLNADEDDVFSANFMKIKSYTT